MTSLLEHVRHAFALPDSAICKASLNAGNTTCGNPFSRAEARADGHPGFCSHECAIEDLENSPM